MSEVRASSSGLPPAQQAHRLLPPDGRGSAHRYSEIRPPAKPTLAGLPETQDVDSRSADDMHEHDWSPEEGQSETLLQIRCTALSLQELRGCQQTESSTTGRLSVNYWSRN